MDRKNLLVKKIIIGIFSSFLLNFLGCALSSCEQKPAPEERIAETTLFAPNNYQLLDFKYDYGVGESTENYILLVSIKDYKEISAEIESKAFFQRLDTAKSPIYAFDNNTNTQTINETACWYDNKYFYEIFRPEIGTITTVILEKDSLMYIYYNDL